LPIWFAGFESDLAAIYSTTPHCDARLAVRTGVGVLDIAMPES
jgi:hypothetical protein